MLTGVTTRAIGRRARPSRSARPGSPTDGARRSRRVLESAARRRRLSAPEHRAAVARLRAVIELRRALPFLAPSSPRARVRRRLLAAAGPAPTATPPDALHPNPPVAAWPPRPSPTRPSSTRSPGSGRSGRAGHYTRLTPVRLRVRAQRRKPSRSRSSTTRVTEGDRRRPAARAATSVGLPDDRRRAVRQRGPERRAPARSSSSTTSMGYPVALASTRTSTRATTSSRSP